MAVKRRVQRKRQRPVRRTHHPVTRGEFDRLVAILNDRTATITAFRHDLEIQFKRMAQIQSEVDELRRTIARIAETIDDRS